MNNIMKVCAVMVASLLLTACNDGGNSTSKAGTVSDVNIQTGDGVIYEYKDFLDYTFNGKYTIGEPDVKKNRPDTEYEQIITSWDITYTGKDGNEVKTSFRSSNYITLDEQLYTSKELHDLSEFDSFITTAMGEIVKTEFVENIASKYMELQYDDLRGVYICPDIGDLTILCYPPVYIGAVEGEDFDKTCDIARQRTTAGSGYSVADSDMKSICSDDEFTFTCQFVINKDLDQEKYISIIENMQKDFEEYVGAPMNYNFFLAETENPSWLYRDMNLLGEDVSTEQIESGEVVYAEDLKNHILSKY
ncbi:MAG: hypothetical protein IKV85_03860 [Ruminococcus sp.]|nr:hypothetical protein [Ruminococcus sp.]